MITSSILAFISRVIRTISEVSSVLFGSGHIGSETISFKRVGILGTTGRHNHHGAPVPHGQQGRNGSDRGGFAEKFNLQSLAVALVGQHGHGYALSQHAIEVKHGVCLGDHEVAAADAAGQNGLLQIGIIQRTNDHGKRDADLGRSHGAEAPSCQGAE